MDTAERLRNLGAAVQKVAKPPYLDSYVRPGIDEFRDDVYKEMGAVPHKDGEAMLGGHEIKLEIGLGNKGFYCGVLYGTQDLSGGETLDSFDCSSMSYRDVARRAEKVLRRFLGI